MMNLKQALQRIETLERRVKELEARQPEQHIHYYTQPLQVPTYQPIYPPPYYDPTRWYPPMPVTCGVPTGVMGAQ